MPNDSTQTRPLVSPTMLFRFSIECRYLSEPWSKSEIELPEAYAIPSFSELDEGRPLFAHVRVGWHESVIGVSVRAQGKKQEPWCRESRAEDSDGLSLFLDTRNTQTIHRASRFCHHFLFLPEGAGRNHDQPVARLMPIHRAKESPKPVGAGDIKIHSEHRVDGYILRAFILQRALTGYEPDEHIRIGFSYAVTDRELGWQTFSVGSEFPFMSDPSLWGTLELVQ